MLGMKFRQTRGMMGPQRYRISGEIMKIKDKECLHIISCNIHGHEYLNLSKGAAMRLINGKPIHFPRVMAEFTYYQTDHKGRMYYDIPLRLVPLRWGLLLLHKLGFRKSIRREWDVFEPYQEASRLKTQDDRITSFKIGVLKETAPE